MLAHDALPSTCLMFDRGLFDASTLRCSSKQISWHSGQAQPSNPRSTAYIFPALRDFQGFSILWSLLTWAWSTLAASASLPQRSGDTSAGCAQSMAASHFARDCWHLESFRYRGTMNLSVSHLNPVYNDSQIHPWATLKRSKQWGCLCSLQRSFPSSSPGIRAFDPLLSSPGQGAYGRKGSYGEKFAATLYSSICSLSHMASTPRCCWPSTERLVAKVGPCSKGSGCVLHNMCVLSTFRFKTLRANGNSTWFP